MAGRLTRPFAAQIPMTRKPTLAALPVIYIASTATLLTLANRFAGLGGVLNAQGHVERCLKAMRDAAA